MTKEILIVKNITREGPGILAELLDERSIPYTVLDLLAGEMLPDHSSYGAVVVLGGPNSANDTDDTMVRELAWIKSVVAAGIPYLGICLGLQTLVKAHGGAVVPNHVQEIGFRDHEGERFSVELTEAGKANPLFADLGDTFQVFHLHGETVELTPDMTLLASGKHCTNQIVRVGENAFGIQCHFELTEDMFETWLANDPDLQALDAESLRADFAATKDSYTEVGKKLFNNFLTIAGY